VVEPACFVQPSTATVAEPASRAPLALHRRLPGYVPTPLIDLPALARELGIGRLWVKDESCRLGLPAFKILGASWATLQALERHAAEAGAPLGPWQSVAELAAQLRPLLPLTLAAATDGNHGRAVAHMARLLGLGAHIFVPLGTADARIEALRDEGAAVTVVDGSYDDAVALSATMAGPRCLVISDTSWPGYERVPREVIAGYSTIFWEIDDALERAGAPAPDLLLVQMGVGALAAAAVAHLRQPGRTGRLVGVEPTRAACILASMRAGAPVLVLGPHDSIMAGLNCGMPSLIAWPLVSTGIDAYLAIDDERARQGMRLLAAHGVTAGETGAAGLGGLLELLGAAQLQQLRDELGLHAGTQALVLVTEGATDPLAYAEITGSAPTACQEQRRCPLCRGEEGG
jgi:diaminopropionate ammonia-lyase